MCYRDSLCECFSRADQPVKTIIFIKWFEKFPLGTLTFLAVFWRKRNCIIFKYDFVYNHRLKKHGGGRSLKRRILTTTLTFCPVYINGCTYTNTNRMIDDLRGSLPKIPQLYMARKSWQHIPFPRRYCLPPKTKIDRNLLITSSYARHCSTLHKTLITQIIIAASELVRRSRVSEDTSH